MANEPSTVHPERIGPSDVERVEDLDAPPEDVWAAIASPEGLSDWLGDEVEADLRPGGEGLVRDGGETRVLLVDELVPGHRLAFTWWPWHDRAERSYVELEVVPHLDGSRLVIRETRLASAPGRAVLLSVPPAVASRRWRVAA